MHYQTVETFFLVVFVCCVYFLYKRSLYNTLKQLGGQRGWAGYCMTGHLWIFAELTCLHIYGKFLKGMYI